VVKHLYGDTAVTHFGPLALKAVRQEMVKLGWAHSHINPQVGRIRRMFKWGVGNEMVPPSILHGLQAVAGLRRGKTEAREREPVRPVPEALVNAIKDHVARQVWAMIELQLLTGMRPGEVSRIRTGDVDTSGGLWVYSPTRHKTQNHGHQRTIYLGPKAQEVLRRFLRPNPDEYVFSPADAEAERREKLHAERVKNGTPLTCGNRPGTNKRCRPQRAPGGRYTVTAYLRAIYAGCDAAFPPRRTWRGFGCRLMGGRDTPPARRRMRSGGHAWATRSGPH
jgi:integrase